MYIYIPGTDSVNGSFVGKTALVVTGEWLLLLFTDTMTLFRFSPNVLFFATQGRVGQKTIIFLMTCASVDFFSKVLSQLPAIQELGLKVEGLHGRMVQKRRTAVSHHVEACFSGREDIQCYQE